MLPPVEGGRLFAIPYRLDFGGIEKNTAILDHMVEHPLWFAASMPPDEIRIASAWMLTNPEFIKYEVWLGGKLVGMLLVSDIIPKVDALFHFTFFGVSLLSARKLLLNFIGHIFETLDIQRISFEVPEHVKGLERFARMKLGFRFEGEDSCAEHPVVKFLQSKDAGRLHAADAQIWVARQGSRREAAHWDAKTGRYRDIILLRLLKREWEAKTLLPGGEPQATGNLSTGVVNVAEGKERQV